MTKDKLMSDAEGPRILTINCWNEWTEGSYLEPDIVHGMQYLEAVKEIFVNMYFYQPQALMKKIVCKQVL